MENEKKDVIAELKNLLSIAQTERALAVAPYDARIKNLKTALKSLEGFENKSVEINTRPSEMVALINEGENE